MPFIPTAQSRVNIEGSVGALDRSYSRVVASPDAYGAQIGKAISGFADGLNALRVEAKEQEEKNRAEQLALLNANTNLTVPAIEQQNNAPPDGTGLIENTLKAQKDLIDRTAATIEDPKLRQEYRIQQYRLLEGYTNSSAVKAAEMKLGNTKLQTNSALDGVYNRIRVEPTNYDQLLVSGEDVIKNSTIIPEFQKPAMLEGFRKLAANHRFEGLIEAAKTPQELEALKKQLENKDDKWIDKLTAQNFESLQKQIAGKKATITNAVDAQTREVLTGLRTRTDASTLVDPQELTVVRQQIEQTGNPYLASQFALIVRNQNTLRQQKGLPPSAIFTESQLRRGGFNQAYPNLPADVTQQVTEAEKNNPNLPQGLLGNLITRSPYGPARLPENPTNLRLHPALFKNMPDRIATGNTVASQWQKAGYSAVAISGVLANVGNESGFNVNAVGDAGASIGLYQFNIRGEQPRYRAWLAARNLPNTAENQTAYVIDWFEQNPQLKQRLMNARTPQEAAYVFGHFERFSHDGGYANPKGGESLRRQAFAAQFYSGMTNGAQYNPPAVAVAPNVVMTGDSFGVGMAQANGFKQTIAKEGATINDTIAQVNNVPNGATIFSSFGLNDIASGADAQTVRARVKQYIAAVKAKNLNATVIGPPNTNKPYDATTREVDGIMKAEFQAAGINYVSMYGVDLERAGDGIHMKDYKAMFAKANSPQQYVQSLTLQTTQNQRALEGPQGLNRKVTAEELYMAHTIGVDNTMQLIRAYTKDRTALAADVLPGAVQKNEKLFFDGEGDKKRALTVEEVYNRMGMDYLNAPSQVAFTDSVFLHKVAQNKKEQLGKNPIQVVRNDGVNVQPIDPNNPSTYVTRGSQYAQWTTTYELPRSEGKPLDAETEVPAISKRMKDGSAEQVIDELRNLIQLEKGGEGAFSAAMSQLDADKSEYGVAGTLMMNGQEQIAASIVRGVKRMADDKSAAGTFGTGHEVNDAFNAAVGPSLNYLDPKFRDALFRAAKAHYIDNNLGETFSATKFQASVNAVMGGNDKQARVGSINGAKTVLPHGVTESDFNIVVDHLTENDLTALSVNETGQPNAQLPVYGTGEAVNPKDIADYKFRYKGNNTYEVWGPDNQPLMVLEPRPDGRQQRYLMRFTPDAISRIKQRAIQTDATLTGWNVGGL